MAKATAGRIFEENHIFWETFWLAAQTNSEVVDAFNVATKG
jgi:hypothetical protein